MRQALLALVLAAPLSACGDRRDLFLGMFEGTTTETVTWSDGTGETVPSDDRIYISPSADGRQVFISELCNLTGEIRSDELWVLPVNCSSFTFENCNWLFSVDEGRGVIRGDDLTLTYVGDVIVQCAEGTFSGTLSTTVEATRR